MNPCTSQIVIPARLASTRLPRKLLLRETGKTLLEHTYEAASRARRPNGVCVAADTAEIFAAVRAFGGNVEMTDPQAASGADRVAEVARRLEGVDIIVNVQGDEPELSGESIDLVIGLLEQDAAAVMATLATPIRSRRQLEDPACVKVVFDASGRALYFSRSPIPLCPGLERRSADGRAAAFLPARGSVRLSPRVPPATGPHAAIRAGAGREVGAVAGVAGRLCDPGRRG